MKQRLLTIFALLAMLPLVTLAADAPKVGESAPDFSLQDQNGDTHALSNYRGQWIVLYFYPKDDTPGCTTEACSFRDNIFRFKKLGATVLGVSLDDVESHKEFATKYKLPFTILADATKAVATRYGVLTSLGPLEFARRETFLIDPQGVIVKHYEDVNPGEHDAQLLGDLEKLTAVQNAGSTKSDDSTPKDSKTES